MPPDFEGHRAEPPTTTPIKHLIVIFNENQSFDHYFGIYPHATNVYGEPRFVPRPFTPQVNGLDPTLLYNNPNYTNNAPTTGNGTAAANPFRLDRSQAHTTSMNHGYAAEEAAYDEGKMDLFPKWTGFAGFAGTATFSTSALVMGYYDGNTVTALWNYAQHFALNDNSFDTQFGSSSPGAVNLISGQTNGVVSYSAGSVADQQTTLAGSGPLSVVTGNTGSQWDDGAGGYTLLGDIDPTGDACAATTKATGIMQGKNIGDLLNARNISWGFFQGGFDLTATNANGTTGCARSTTSDALQVGLPEAPADYIPHHEPFQYYASTRNPSHVRPTSIHAIGRSTDTGPDKANHQYDTHDFFDALNVGNLPSVTYLKAPAYQDAHPSNSDPLDEQTFVVNVINALQDSPFWESSAVVIAYDDSDGWYDHVPHVMNPSFSTADGLTGKHECQPLPGTQPVALTTPLPGINGQPANGRCGYGPRQPLLVISPWAKHNFVDHTLTDQTSILRFVEDNWLDGERIGQGSYDAYAGSLLNMFDFHQLPYARLKLDPDTGLVKFP